MERSLSDIICENTDIKSLQKNVFLTKNPSNSLIPCNDGKARQKLDFAMIAQSFSTVLGGEYTPNPNHTNVQEDSKSLYGVWKDENKKDTTGTMEKELFNAMGVPQSVPKDTITQKFEKESKLKEENLEVPPTPAMQIPVEPSMKNDQNIKENEQFKLRPQEVPRPGLAEDIKQNNPNVPAEQPLPPQPMDLPPGAQANILPSDDNTIENTPDNPPMENVVQPSDRVPAEAPQPSPIPQTPDQGLAMNSPAPNEVPTMPLELEQQNASTFPPQVNVPQLEVTQYPLQSRDRNMLTSPENEQAPQNPQEVQQPDITSLIKEGGPPISLDGPRNNAPTQQETDPVTQPDDVKKIPNVAKQTSEAPQNVLPSEVRGLQGADIEQPPQPNPQNFEVKETMQGPSEPDSPKETEIHGDPY